MFHPGVFYSHQGKVTNAWGMDLFFRMPDENELNEYYRFTT